MLTYSISYTRSKKLGEERGSSKQREGEGQILAAIARATGHLAQA